MTRWVSCAKDVNFGVAERRHLLPDGADTTLCGATGMGEGVWRGNTVKKPCVDCLAVGGDGFEWGVLDLTELGGVFSMGDKIEAERNVDEHSVVVWREKGAKLWIRFR